ncbi:right-handed parallel beta-helix repeat-containing protein [Cytophagaceae bacterium ABcell3]|nr:right-handed parallel beta-helix repeat-containing protein [Cytophagaceae bacterium ABcell3]
MKKILLPLLFLYGLFMTLSISAQPTGLRTFYVAPDGNNNNSGSVEAPFATLNHAISISRPGDVFIMRGGTYQHSGTIQIPSSRSGTSEQPIIVYAYSGETPVLDFSSQSIGSNNNGIRLNASYWQIVGITIKNAGHNGIRMDGSHNILDRMTAHGCNDTGIHMAGGASHNLVKNCDSYQNFNVTGNIGNNADGFSAKFDVGPGNKFYGCRSWENSDDGFDLWRAQSTVTIENCWVFGNGDASVFGNPEGFRGNGNGIKLGGDGVPGDHIVIRNLAFDNKDKGFDHNNNSGALTLLHNTAYNNGRNYYFPNDPSDGSKRHIYRNNLSAVSNVIASLSPNAIEEGNSWQVSSEVTEDEFLSVNTALAKSPRQPDGSLPEIDLLRPKPSSFLINAGVDLGEPYNGSGPDIGAFELGEETTEVVLSELLVYGALIDGFSPNLNSYTIEIEEGEEIPLVDAVAQDGVSFTITQASSVPGEASVLATDNDGIENTYTVSFIRPADCAGEPGGEAFIDDCQVCAGGNTGIEPNNCSRIFVFTNNSGDREWDNPANWDQGRVPAAGDTAIVPQGELLTSEATIEAVVSIVGEGSVRIMDERVIENILLDGGELRLITGGNETFLTSSIEVVSSSRIQSRTEQAFLTLYGSISGEASLTTLGSGEIILSNDGSQFSGDWDITEGTVRVVDVSALGSGEVSVRPGSSLYIENDGVEISSLSLEGSLHLSNSVSIEEIYINGTEVGPGTYTAEDFPDFIFGDGTLTVPGEPWEQDCNGDIGGTASIDDCGECTGGETGKEPNSSCEQDCNGDFGGTASIDDCGECTGGDTGKEPNSSCEQDCNGDFGGAASIDDCGECTGGDTGKDPNSSCEQDCNGDFGGTASIDDCGECTGGDTGKEPNSSCEQDCNGDFGGTASIDDCGECTGGDTGKEPNSSCEQDCNGGFGGTASIDDCGECTGGDTGKDPNSSCEQDCNGDFGGTASIDDCGECTGGDTGKEPNSSCEQDCNGDLGGTASIDNCGECTGGDTGKEINYSCAQDCNGDWAGEAYIDECGECVGGNTGEENCTPTSVNEADFASVQMYPNPFNSEIHLKTDGLITSVRVEICDMSGKVVYTAEVSGNNKISAASWPVGPYFVRLSSDTDVRIYKLIKQ